jgi:hypothetical protein
MHAVKRLFVTCILLFLLRLTTQLHHIQNEDGQHHPIQNHGIIINTNLTTFWLNSNDDQQRTDYMHHMLPKIGLTRNVRVSAITPNSDEYKIIELEKPCKRNTDRDIAVILSHLKAIYQAIYHDPSTANDYALIIEDDIRFVYSLNLTNLIQSAPPNFGILQLTTSNHEAVKYLWNDFSHADSADSSFWYLTNWKNTSKNGKEYLFWSAQAYIIHKTILKPIIDNIVLPPTVQESSNNNQSLSFRIVNSFFPNQCFFTTKRPCILANCLFADTYIYSIGQPTYISKIPFVTGGKVGLNSTIHQIHVQKHKEGFSMIKSIQLKLDQWRKQCYMGEEGLTKDQVLVGKCHALDQILLQ